MLASVAWTLWLGAAPSAAADSRPAALTITVAPEEVSLARGELATFVVLLHNSSAEQVTNLLVVDGATTSALELSVPATAGVAVAPGGTLSMRVGVKRLADTEAAKLPAAVVASYTQSAPGASPALPPVEEVTVGELVVKPVAAPAVVESAFKATDDAVSEDHPTGMVLLITNKRTGPVSLTSLTISSPVSVRTKLPAGAVANVAELTVESGTDRDVLDGRTIEIPAFTTRIVPLVVEGTRTVQPGSRVLLARVTAHAGPGAADVEVVSTQSLKVEVFGESAILGALGVPLLLLLPGVIIITTLAVLLKYLSPWRHILGVGSPDITSKASIGAVAGVLVSLLVVQAYPVLTRLIPGDGRNLRRSYGFDDFYYVYLWSLLIAIVLWGVASAAKPVWQWAFIPQATDDEEAILRKLAFRGAPLVADLVKVDGADASRDLAVHAAGHGYRWYLTPPIKAVLAASAPQDLVEALKGPKLRPVRKALAQAKREGSLTSLSFQRTPFILKPAAIDPAKVTPNLQTRKLVDT